MLSGIYCSNTNQEKKVSEMHSKTTVLEGFEMDSTFNPEKAKAIDRYFSNRFASNLFSGSVLFYDSGKYYSNSYGYANGRLRTKLSPDMPFQIASVSKTLTAYTILSLIDKGLLKLSTPINEILLGFPYTQLNVEHLLTHKSGLPNYMHFAETFYKTKYASLTNNEVLSILKRYKPALEFRPNSRYKYSNTNYVLLALIVERVSNIPFETYLKDSVFIPMGMMSSFIFTPAMSLKNQVVQGHSDNRTIFPEFYQNGTMGDKGVYTNVFDLLKFDQAIRKNFLVTAGTLDDACTPHTPCRPTLDYYGYGWRIRYYNTGDTIIYHNGWWQGYKAYFVRWKNKDRCVIVLANTVKGGFIKQTDLMSLMDGNKPKATAGGEAD